MRSTDIGPAVSLTELAYAWPGAASFSIMVEDFAVSTGETVLLLGQSGSGKSTLLSLVCGIFPPDRGRVIVDGVDFSTLGPSQRDRFRAEHIGVIFQLFNLLPYASAVDNVVLPIEFAPGRRAKLTASPRRAAIEILQGLGLPRSVVEYGPAAELSVGQQQRVAVARALIGAPSLIIADEPTSSLDGTSQARFLDLLFENVQNTGTTLIMVSHDERLAPRFDRTVLLSDIAEVKRGTGT
ncbi:MAG: ABC transporter ATP-binding protein [Hyphomicrobiaceae bacterium]